MQPYYQTTQRLVSNLQEIFHDFQYSKKEKRSWTELLKETFKETSGQLMMGQVYNGHNFFLVIFFWLSRRVD
jgi:hypothetical protein